MNIRDIKIRDFKLIDVSQAIEIAYVNYEEERKQVMSLPKELQIPDLTHFAENGLGAVALSGDRLLGYFGAYQPLENAFGTTGVRGTFSPVHAHGVTAAIGSILQDDLCKISRGQIYSLLYQTAAKKWVDNGILSHAVAIYAHDIESIQSFFYNGFGLRCIDAVRLLEEIPEMADPSLSAGIKLEYQELPRDDWRELLSMHNQLIAHLATSPCFMRFNPIDEEELYRRAPKDVRYFTALADGQFAAYIKIADNGENFITEHYSMLNICGAYCNPAYRGIGVYHNLLCYMMKELKQEGYRTLGVDFESFNPTARGFWFKYFTAYTNSVVRRIDDNAVCI